MNARDNTLNQTTSAMPIQEISLDVLQEKYCKGSESSIVEVQHRDARTLAEVETDFEKKRV